MSNKSNSLAISSSVYMIRLVFLFLIFFLNQYCPSKFVDSSSSSKCISPNRISLFIQMIMLEGAKATTETVDALRSGASAMKAMQKAT